MELLGIHVHLELKMRLGDVVLDLEDCDPALVVLDVPLVLPFHLSLSLLPGELVVLVPLQVVIESLLNNLLDFLFDPRRISDGFFAHDFHVVAELDLRQGCWEKAQLHFLLLVLLLVKALHPTKLLLLLLCQVNGNDHGFNLFDVIVLQLPRMLDVMSDLFKVNVLVPNLSVWEPSQTFFATWGSWRKKLRIPPFQLWDGIIRPQVCCLAQLDAFLSPSFLPSILHVCIRHPRIRGRGFLLFVLPLLMLFYDLPLPQDFTSLDEGPLLNEVEGSVLPAIPLVLLELDGGVKELPLGEEVATGGLSELLQTDQVSRRSLVLAQGLEGLLVNHQLAVFFEVQDVALVV